MNFYEKVGNRITTARNEANLKQNELADACKISRGRLSNWEVGTRLPKPQEIKKLAEVLKVPAAWLYCLSDDLREYETHGGQMRLVPALHLNQINTPTILNDLKKLTTHPDLDSLNRYDFVPLSFSPDTKMDQDSFAVIVTDEGMAPEILLNDLLVINPSLSPNPGQIVVAYVSDEPFAVIRKFRKPSKDTFELVSANKDWPSYQGKNNDKLIKILGTAIELRRNI
jgi:SOS-response transcriptional repressor LexA